MKKLVMFLSTIMLILSLSGVVGATIYEFVPSDSDLGDLEHGHYYAWGIEVDPLLQIESVTLTFSNIRNWDFETNDLWVHLLDSTDLGVQAYKDDNDGQIDQFEGDGPLLNHWHNLSATPQDIIYMFDASEINAFVNYRVDGVLGFGFDPDCHFYNDGVKLTIETGPVAEPVAEPATMLLLGAGLVSLAGLKRKKKQ